MSQPWQPYLAKVKDTIAYSLSFIHSHTAHVFIHTLLNILFEIYFTLCPTPLCLYPSFLLVAEEEEKKLQERRKREMQEREKAEKLRAEEQRKLTQSFYASIVSTVKIVATNSQVGHVFPH